MKSLEEIKELPVIASCVVIPENNFCVFHREVSGIYSRHRIGGLWLFKRFSIVSKSGVYLLEEIDIDSRVIHDRDLPKRVNKFGIREIAATQVIVATLGKSKVSEGLVDKLAGAFL